MVPYAAIPYSVNDSATNRELALRAARESMVLLKNDGILPFRDRIKRIAVIGPNADSMDVLLGNYNGTPSRAATVLSGMRARFGADNILYAEGAPLAPGIPLTTSTALPPMEAALAAARNADVVVMVLGISPRLE